MFEARSKRAQPATSSDRAKTSAKAHSVPSIAAPSTAAGGAGVPSRNTAVMSSVFGYLADGAATKTRARSDAKEAHSAKNNIDSNINEDSKE